jgi:C-8 sterol isomerase
VIIFGTALGSSGHSGRFLVDDFFMVLEGEQWTQRAGETEMRRYEPGSINHLEKGEAFQYRMPGRCYAMEYARGWIPTMMPFGLIEVFTSTFDFYTLGRTLLIYTKLVGWNLLTGKI